VIAGVEVGTGIGVGVVVGVRVVAKVGLVLEAGFSFLGAANTFIELNNKINTSTRDRCGTNNFLEDINEPP
jgi:hypothetical protein